MEQEEIVTLEDIANIEIQGKKADLSLIRRTCELLLELKNTSPYGTMFVLGYEDRHIENELDPLYNGDELVKNQYGSLDMYDNIADQLRSILSVQDDGAFLVRNSKIYHNGYEVTARNKKYLRDKKIRLEQQQKPVPTRHNLLGFNEPVGTRHRAAIAASRDDGFIIATLSEESHDLNEFSEEKPRRIRFYIGNQVYQLLEPVDEHIREQPMPQNVAGVLISNVSAPTG